MSQTRRHLFWFTRDLRIHDQAALQAAAEDCDQLLCVYCPEPWYSPSDVFGVQHCSAARQRFLAESLESLRLQLEAKGQRLIILNGDVLTNLVNLVERYEIDRIVRSQIAGYYEARIWSELRSRLNHCEFTEAVTHTLFEARQLPFELADLPPTFTRFRKQVENREIRSVASTPEELPPPLPVAEIDAAHRIDAPQSKNPPIFRGGTAAGMARLQRYFESTEPSRYKKVRNSLDGLDNSTKFSPWLANGGISPLDVMQHLREYERRQGANESTYWIFFELLWREFFQWHAHQHGARLFYFSGVQNRRVLQSFYPQRFQQWANGSTPYPLVNAIMNELRKTGYISNRARQITASCFVNELSLDWRYGAQWFEQQLLDYDVASNWGNWQYLAGVGADVQSKRHFNLEKQAQQFDPEDSYTNKWNGYDHAYPIDAVDAADWPI